MIRTLIIEDEPAVRKEIQWLLQQDIRFNLIGSAANVADGLVLIRTTNPELILLDIQLTDGSAFDLINQLNDISFKIIFITAYNHLRLRQLNMVRSITY